MLERLTKCFTCNSYFTSSKLFNEHFKSHLDETKIKAKEEEQEIAKEFQNAKNEMIHKSVNKGNQCKQCDKTFSCIRNVRRHIETVHKKLKKFKCDACEQTFGHNGDLKRHVETIHMKLKVFK